MPHDNLSSSSPSPLPLPSLLSLIRPSFQKCTPLFANRNESLDITAERLQKETLKAINRAKGKVDKLLCNLEECLNWPKVHHEGQLLQSHLYLWKKGMKILTVNDWENNNIEREISLTPPLTGKEEVTKRFRTSKKLKKGIPHIERELTKAKDLVTALIEFAAHLEEIRNNEDILPILNALFPPKIEKPSPLTEVKRLPYREYFSSNGEVIWVGKTAQDNETLTFSLANGSDFWLHVQGAPGSHVIIKGFKRGEPDPITVKEACQLALFYSQARKQGNADVIVTQQKFVTRFGKGEKNVGKVQVSKHSTTFVRLDLEKINTIRRQKPTPTL